LCGLVLGQQVIHLPSRAGRESIAIPRAFVTKVADGDALIDQTTIPREEVSGTASG